MQVVRLRPNTSDHLNLIRGLSALAVLVGHVRGLFFQDWKDVLHANPFTYLLYTVTGLGHQAVMVFFVLSGFFVGGSVIKVADQWSWRQYLCNRLVRLYLVLIPALLLTAVIDQFSIRMPLGNLYFFHPIFHFNTEPLVSAISRQTFLGNALFLQSIVVRPFGSDAPLWSLSNEFWYYMLFPLVLLSFCAIQGRVRVVYLCLAVGIAVFLPRGMLLGFLIWLLGAAMHAFPGQRLRPFVVSMLRTVSMTGFAFVLILVRLNRIPDGSSDFCVGLSFAIWMYCLLLEPRLPIRGPGEASARYSRGASVLAGCSYSVYAIHLPLVMFARTAITSKPWQPTPGYLAIGFLIAAGAFVAGYMFSKATEAQTDRVRRKILEPINVSSARVVDLGHECQLVTPSARESSIT